MSPRILILAADPQTWRHWAALLGGAAGQVVPEGVLAPDAAPPDVIVADASLPIETLRGRLASSDAGVVLMGPLGDDAGIPQADIRLPADFTPRELALACRLTAQVVRLRRRLGESHAIAAAAADPAYIDDLTGLPNRRAWQRELESRLAAGKASFCLAILDLDRFKQVNDGWGLDAGDRVLRAAGQALASCLRQGDFVARLGGDEFGLLLAGLSAADAPHVVERVRTRLPIGLAALVPQVVSASAGYAVYDAGQALTPEALFAAAAAELRRAKGGGGSRA